MEWIKRNLGFVVVGAASLVLLGGAVWFLFAQMGNNTEADQALTDLLAQRQQLVSAPVHPIGKGDVVNIDEARKDRERLGGFLGSLKSVIPAMPAATEIDDQGLKNLLEQTIYQLNQSATNVGIVVPDPFAFSFQSVRGAYKFNSNSVQTLVLQIGDIRELTTILIDSGVSGITTIRRPAMTQEDQASTTGGGDFLALNAKTNEFTISFPYELTFQSFSTELAEIVNRMMKSKLCVVVKNIDVAPGSGMLAGMGESRGGAEAQGFRNPYPDLRSRYGGGDPYRRSMPEAAQPGMNPNQPIVVLDSQPLRVTMLVDVVRLVANKAP